ncbi:hypothetical protein D3C81_2042610 [compost metagenome]
MGLSIKQWHLLVIEEAGMPLGNAPQIATTVIRIRFSGLPAVLIDVQIAPRVDMSLPRLERGGYMPDAVQLVTGVFGVQVTRLNDVVIAQLG